MPVPESDQGRIPRPPQRPVMSATEFVRVRSLPFRAEASQQAFAVPVGHPERAGCRTRPAVWLAVAEEPAAPPAAVADRDATVGVADPAREEAVVRRSDGCQAERHAETARHRLPLPTSSGCRRRGFRLQDPSSARLRGSSVRTLFPPLGPPQCRRRRSTTWNRCARCRRIRCRPARPLSKRCRRSRRSRSSRTA